jgi:transcriptional regulator with XRE-family HTH domain
MTNKQFVSNKLRFHRQQANLFQKDVAKSLGLDCADRISHWENGIAMPNVVNLFRLAAIYKVTPQELYPDLYEMAKSMNQSTQDDVGSLLN